MANREAVAERDDDQGGTYRLDLVNCGSARCLKCAEGPAHGPYWFRYYRRGGKVVSNYVGKNLPGAADAVRPGADRVDVDARILAALAELAPQPAGFATLVSLRQRLQRAGLDRADVDAALDRMYQINLVRRC